MQYSRPPPMQMALWRKPLLAVAVHSTLPLAAVHHDQPAAGGVVVVLAAAVGEASD